MLLAVFLRESSAARDSRIALRGCAKTRLEVLDFPIRRAHWLELHQGRTIIALRSVPPEPFKDLLDLFQPRCSADGSDELSFRNVETHLGLKQGRLLITPGVCPEFNQLAGTHYLGHEENMAHREQLRDTVRAWGVEV